MQDSNKKEFWLIMNIAMECTNHYPLSKEAIVTWYAQLKEYDFIDVSNAIDSWLKNNKKTPTPNDIRELCKPMVPMFKMLPAPLNIESNKIHAIEIKYQLSTLGSYKRDMKAWARKIISNPKNYPDISLRYATEALGEHHAI